MDILNNYLEELQGKHVGYVGKYANKTISDLKNMGKNPWGYSYFRLDRGEATLAAGVGAGILIFMALKLFKRYATKTGKVCKDYSPSSIKHKICSVDVKIEARKKQLSELKSKIGLCDKTKKPDQCKSKVKKYIDETVSKILKLQNKKEKYMRKVKMGTV